MISFNNVKISDIGKIVTGKTPKTSIPEYFDSDYMFIGPIDLHRHFIVTESEKMISVKGLQSIKGSRLQGTSILVGCIGWDMGNVAITESECATNQQINSVTNIKEDYNPYYIYYWLKTKKDFLFQQASVTRTPILNKTSFSDIEVNIPEKNYQDFVVDILKTIDKKIELNNKINTELEAMAKLIYDYWFVQFDFPDDNGKPYKSSGGKMVYNEELKREIPDGWNCGVLSDISELVRGVTYSKDDLAKKEDNNVIPILRATNISGNKINLENMKYVHKDFVSKKQILSEYDVLITMSSGSKDHIGKNGLYYFDDRVSFGAFCAKLVANDGFQYYLYAYTQSDFMFNTIKNECLGTNINNLNSSLVYGFRVVIPEMKIIESYNQHIKAVYKKVGSNQKENQKLSELRDWLLPMLMNGQVTVKEL